MDPSATNWNPLATVDDGNCTFSSPPVGENTLNGVINSSDSITCPYDLNTGSLGTGDIVINDTTSPIQIVALPGNGSTSPAVVARWRLELLNSNGAPIVEGIDFTYTYTGPPPSTVYINVPIGVGPNKVYRYPSINNTYSVDIIINTPGSYTYSMSLVCVPAGFGSNSQYNSTLTISV
jgi:hypothetical protein